MNIQESNDPSDRLPAPHLAPDWDKRLQGIEASLAELKAAIIGNSELGHRGIVQRLIALEARADLSDSKTDQIDRKLIKWGGIVTGAMLALEWAKSKLMG